MNRPINIYAMPKVEPKKVFISHLRRKRKLRKDREGSHEKRGKIIDATSISERSKEVESRKVPSHWEGDVMVGKNHRSALGTVVERTTRMVFLSESRLKRQIILRKAFTDIFQEIDPELRKPLTYERGHGMADINTL